MKRILLIEDEPGLVLTLSDRLSKEGFAVESARDGESGLQRATTEAFDLILLDVMLPRKNGFDVCRDLRQQGSQTPVLMLTARGQVVDKVALLRRAPAAASSSTEVYQFGAVRVDFRKAEVTRDGEPVELSAREFALLRYFIEHRESAITRDALLNEVWGYNAMPSTRTVDVHVAWLRQKLEPNPRHPQYILTVHGLGYKFVG